MVAVTWPTYRQRSGYVRGSRSTNRAAHPSAVARLKAHRPLGYAGARYPSFQCSSRAARGAQALGRSRPQPALGLALRHPGPLPLGRPGVVGELGSRSDPAAGRCVGRAAADALPGQEVRQEPEGHPGRPRRLPDGRSVVPGLRGREPGRAEGHRVLLTRVRHHRGAAAVLRRPGHPGRRPPEGGQRPRRADHRRRAALPAGLLPPVAELGRLAAGALPAARPQCPAADAAARRRRPGPDRSCRWTAARCSPRSGWRRSAGCRC